MWITGSCYSGGVGFLQCRLTLHGGFDILGWTIVALEYVSRMKGGLRPVNKQSSDAAGQAPPNESGPLFSHAERKQILKKYIIFLGWMEILIFIVCWLYQLGHQGYDRYGPVEILFPWNTYFLIAFLTPVAITFLLGVVLIGFNKYIVNPGEVEDGDTPEQALKDALDGGGKRRYRLISLLAFMRKLPFLLLLLILAAAAGVVYKLDAIIEFASRVGQKTVEIGLIVGAVLLGVGTVVGIIVLVLNYKLRKRSMDLQYRSEVAERFGIILLDDNTVLNHEGKMLIQGKKWKDSVPLLPVSENTKPDTPRDPVESGGTPASDGS